MSLRDKLDDGDFLMLALKGDKSAYDFCMMWVEMVSTWDDLIDKDVAISDEEINRMMQAALLLPTNEFYMRNIGSLQPMIQMGILNWHISNELAARPGLPREVAHISRYSASDVILYSVMLKGGLKWGREHCAELRLRCQGDDTFDVFNAEMKSKYGEDK